MANKHPPGKDVRTLAERLIGTCHLFDPEELHEWPIKKLREFDALCFSCEGCGWWCGDNERHEIDYLWYCGQCAEELE